MCAQGLCKDAKPTKHTQTLTLRIFLQFSTTAHKLPPQYLPPLSKGGGLTARHKLSLCCILLAIRPPFYSLNFSAVKTEGLPNYHTSLAPTLPKPHYPLLCTIALASLVKGEVLSPERIRATTGGIASPPSLSPHQPFQNRTIPLAFRTAIVCVCLYGLHLNYPTHFS